jgi:hypothetical protein
MRVALFATRTLKPFRRGNFDQKGAFDFKKYWSTTIDPVVLGACKRPGLSRGRLFVCRYVCKFWLHRNNLHRGRLNKSRITFAFISLAASYPAVLTTTRTMASTNAYRAT